MTLDEMTPQPFEPRIVGFMCNWCSYAAADKAGAAQEPFSPNVSIVKVMCSGRVDPQFVLKAFELGADGVLILACHPGCCHYKEGNYRAAARHKLLQSLLVQLGIPPDRCRFDYVSAGEGEKYVQVINDMVVALKSLGPIGSRGGTNGHSNPRRSGSQVSPAHTQNNGSGNQNETGGCPRSDSRLCDVREGRAGLVCSSEKGPALDEERGRLEKALPDPILMAGSRSGT